MRRQRGCFLLASIDWMRFFADFVPKFSRGVNCCSVIVYRSAMWWQRFCVTS